MDLSRLRQDYRGESLDESAVAADPIAQFRAWFDDAVKSELPMVNAMTLATVSSSGQPSARMVLLKGVDARGFVFYTDYGSRKAQELAANARAALLFYWIELEREVRVEGRVEKTTRADTQAYFATRPLGSRLAAIASPQSAVLSSRAELETRYRDAADRFGEEAPCPPGWGGYRVLPESIEFWQGRPNRLHDRLLYRKSADGRWAVVRLAP